MHLRIRRYFNQEMIAVRLADEGHQFIGVVKLARCGSRHRRGRQVSAQGHNALDASIAVTLQMRGDVGARGADAGKVRRNFNAAILHYRQQRLIGSILIGTARAMRHREKLWPPQRELTNDGRELCSGLGRPRRRKLK